MKVSANPRVKTQLLSEIVRVRVTPDDLEIIIAAANSERKRPSVYLRDVVMAGALGTLGCGSYDQALTKAKNDARNS